MSMSLPAQPSADNCYYCTHNFTFWNHFTRQWKMVTRETQVNSVHGVFIQEVQNNLKASLFLIEKCVDTHTVNEVAEPNLT